MFDVLGERSSLLAERVQYSMELTCERALPTLIPMLDDSRIKRGGLSVNLLQIWFIYSNFPTTAGAANFPRLYCGGSRCYKPKSDYK